jgi:cytochrome c
MKCYLAVFALAILIAGATGCSKALPLVNVAGLFPEYNRRAGRLISLGDRVVDWRGRTGGHRRRQAAGPVVGS